VALPVAAMKFYRGELYNQSLEVTEFGLVFVVHIVLRSTVEIHYSI